MAKETKTRIVRITWVDAQGNAACIGLDETIRSDWTPEECRTAAIYHAQCQGIDTDRFHPEISEEAIDY
jgi:hypothetical protein